MKFFLIEKKKKKKVNDEIRYGLKVVDQAKSFHLMWIPAKTIGLCFYSSNTHAVCVQIMILDSKDDMKQKSLKRNFHEVKILDA